MWFRVSFYIDKPSLHAVIALDGNVYFKATDLGKFLGYSSIYSFGRRHGVRNLNKMIPQEFIPRYYNSRPNTIFPVIDFNDMIKIIRKTYYKHSVRFGEKQIEHLQTLWRFGTVSKHLFPAVLPISPRVAFPINVQPPGIGDMSLQDWIREFSDMTLKMFERYKTSLVDNTLIADSIKAEHSNTDQEDHNYNKSLPQPSIMSPSPNQDLNYLSSPPPSVMNPSSSQDADYMSLPPPSVMPPSVEATNNLTIKYDGLIDNFPDEIYLTACGTNQIYIKA